MSGVCVRVALRRQLWVSHVEAEDVAVKSFHESIRLCRHVGILKRAS